MAAEKNAISGRDGDVVVLGTSICEVTKFDITLKSNNGSGYASNCSSYAKRRRAGTKDFSGSIEGKYAPGTPAYGTGAGQIKEGAEPDLYLYLDDYQYLVAPAVIDDFNFQVDMDSGEIIGFKAGFSARDAIDVTNLAEESSNSSSSSSSSS